MVSAAQVDIYTTHNGDIDLYQHRGSPQMAILGDSWKTIEDLRRRLFLVAAGRASATFASSVEARTFWLGLRMRTHVVAFALWLKAMLGRNRNPKWIARELPFVRGGNGSTPGIRGELWRDG